jgi:hypothetical protein
MKRKMEALIRLQVEVGNEKVSLDIGRRKVR